MIVDVRMHGLAGVTAAYLVHGRDATALVDTGPAASLPATLAALGDVEPDWLVLTHVHLDHAGAAGQLAERFPRSRVAVHARGARHVADPSRLWAGASSVYGDRTEALWGRPLPIDAARVRAVADGESLDLGDRALRALDTPGHANHHLAWLDEATGDAYVGDAVGMQLDGDPLWRATTPPAAFDRDRALQSIERLRGVAPTRLWLGHFGAAEGEHALDDARAALIDWTDAVAAARRRGQRDADLDEAARAWLGRREHATSPAARARFDTTSPPELDVAGVTGWLERADQEESRPHA